MKHLTAVMGVLSLLALAACGGSSGYSSPTAPTSGMPPASNATTVSINAITGSQSFAPNPATAKAGTAVQWNNAHSVTHRIVADNGSFDTGNISPGSTSGSITVTQAGSYAYHCSIHPSMVGTLTVQ